VLESQLVQQIMRWDMAVLRESPWYQEIEQRGRRENMLSNIAMGLEAKFGNDGLGFMAQITQISDFEQLQEILRRIVIANTLEEVQEVL
jgi:predicted transposase YdaD